MWSQPHLREHLAVFAHQAQQEGWSTELSLLMSTMMSHYFKKTIQNQVKLQTSQELPLGREHLAKNLHIFPWWLGHGTHSKRILDGEAAWNKIIWKIKGVVFSIPKYTGALEQGEEVVTRSLRLFHPPSACQYNEPSRRASPQLISAWALHTACPTARCRALLVGWALCAAHKHSGHARYPQR